MSRDIDAIKIEYNSLLAREKKAEEYLEHATPEQLKKWLPEFEKIEIQLSRLIQKFAATAGRMVTHEEIVDGFGGKQEEKQAITGWISVKDRLPDKPGPYIVNYKRSGQPEHDMDWKYRVNIIEYSEYWTEVCQRWWNGHHWAGYGEIVTHWMPLPESPKEDGGHHEV